MLFNLAFFERVALSRDVLSPGILPRVVRLGCSDPAFEDYTRLRSVKLRFNHTQFNVAFF